MYGEFYYFLYICFMGRKRVKQLVYLEKENYDILPKKLRDDKLEYQSLYSKIKNRERSLKKELIKYKKKKEELKDWKIKQTELFNQLIDLHDNLVPTISISFSGQNEGWYENNSWSITMRLKSKLFCIYIGTDKVVREVLNDIYETDEYWNDNNIRGRSREFITKYKKEKKKLQMVLYDVIKPNIIRKLVSLNKNLDGYNEWLGLYENKKLKGMDFLTQ